MNENTNMRVVTLKDLWNIFIQRLIPIVLAAAIAMVLSIAVSNMAYEPKYSSTATLYILRENEGMTTSSGEANNEFTLALKIVNDCTYLLKSRTVVERVIADLGLDMTYKELRGMISTNNPTNTRILEVTVTADSPEAAKVIVDRLCEVGKDSITEAMGFDQVNLYEYGALEKQPANSINPLTHIIIAAALAVGVYIIFVLAYLLDDRIRTQEDIERVLGLSILGEIPNLNGNGKSRYGYSRYGKRYGYGNYSYGYGSSRGHRYGYGYGYGKKQMPENKSEAEADNGTEKRS